MMNSADPMRVRRRAPLRVGYRHHRNGWKGGEERLMLWQIKTTMQRREEGRRLARHHGERVIVEMEMQQIEFLRAPRHLFDHADVKSVGITHGAVESEGCRPHRLKPGAGGGVAARKERNLVSERDQLLRQPGDHPFGSTIKFSAEQLQSMAISERCAILPPVRVLSPPHLDKP